MKMNMKFRKSMVIALIMGLQIITCSDKSSQKNAGENKNNLNEPLPEIVSTTTITQYTDSGSDGTWFNSDDHKSVTEIFSYDVNENLIIKEKQINDIDLNRNINTTQNTYYYNNQNNVRKEIFTDYYGISAFWLKTYVYTESGNISSMTENYNDVYTATTDYTYDSAGLPDYETYTSADVSYTTNHDHDLDGNLTKIQTQLINHYKNNETSNWTYSYTFQTGLKSAMSYIASDGVLTDTTYHYQNGVLTSEDTTHKDISGTTKTWTYTYTYNTAGQLIKKVRTVNAVVQDYYLYVYQ